MIESLVFSLFVCKKIILNTYEILHFNKNEPDFYDICSEEPIDERIKLEFKFKSQILNEFITKSLLFRCLVFIAVSDGEKTFIVSNWIYNTIFYYRGGDYSLHSMPNGK
jgi:hypothetical protein